VAPTGYAMVEDHKEVLLAGLPTMYAG